MIRIKHRRRRYIHLPRFSCNFRTRPMTAMRRKFVLTATVTLCALAQPFTAVLQAEEPAGSQTPSIETSPHTTQLAVALIGSSSGYGLASLPHLPTLMQVPLPPSETSDMEQRKARQQSFRRVQNFLRRGVVPPIQPKRSAGMRPPQTPAPKESVDVQQLPDAPDAPPPL